MADDDKQNQTPVPGGTEAPAESAKPRFKTNNVNLLFRPAHADSADAAGSDQGRATPGAGGVHSPFGSRSGSSSQKGRFTLAVKKDSSSPAPSSSIRHSPGASVADPGKETEPTAASDAGSSASSGASATPSAGAGKETVNNAGTSAGNDASDASTDVGRDGSHSGGESEAKQTQENGNAAAASASAGTSTGPTPAGRHPSTEYTEEELANRGISVAGRFHSASNINWEDEEEDWNPPPQVASMGASFLSSMKAGAPPKPSPATTSKTAAAPKPAAVPPKQTYTAPSAPASTADHAAGSTPWGHQKVAAANSLSDVIREAKEKGSGFRPGAVSRAARPQATGGDALSRFRIRGGAQPASFRGGPPLNPQAGASFFDEEPATFQRASDRMGPGMGPGMGFDSFGRGRNAFPPADDFSMFSRPRAPLNGGEEPPAAIPRRPIPDRLRRVSQNSERPAPPVQDKPSGDALATRRRSTASASAQTVVPADPHKDSDSKRDSEPKQEPKSEPEAVKEPKQDLKPSADAAEAPHSPVIATGSEKAAETTEPAAQPADKAASEHAVPEKSVPEQAAPAQAAPAEAPPIQAAQKQEMVSEVEMAKRRFEAERAAELEKERKLMEKREQMRKELEEKQREEEAKKRARKEELERKHQEREAKRLKEREARRLAEEQAAKEKAAMEKEAKKKAEAEKKRQLQEHFEAIRKQQEQLKQSEAEKPHNNEGDGQAQAKQRPVGNLPQRPAADRLASQQHEGGSEDKQTSSKKDETLPIPRDVRATYPSRLLRPRTGDVEHTESQALPDNVPKAPSAVLRAKNESVANKESTDSRSRFSNVVVKLPKSFGTRGVTTAEGLSALPRPTSREGGNVPSSFPKDIVTIKLSGMGSTTVKWPHTHKKHSGKKPQHALFKKFRQPRTANTTA